MQFFERKLAGGMALEDSFRRAAEPGPLREGAARDATPGRWSRTSPRPTSASSCCSARSSRRSRRRATTSSASRRPGPYVAALEARGSATSRCATRPARSRRREDAQALAELVSVFRRLRPAIVHTHNPKPGLYGRVAAAVAAVPVVVNTVHGLYAQPQDPLAKRALVYGARARRGDCSRTPSSCRTPKTSRRSRASACRGASSRCSATASTSRRFDPGDRRPPTTCRPRVRELGACGSRRRRGRARRPAGAREGLPRGVRGRAPAARARAARCGSRSSATTTTRRPTRSTPTTARVAAAAGVRFLGGRDDVAAPVRGHGRLRAGVAPRGLPALADGGGGDGPAGRRDRHPRLPPGRRRRRHRPARRRPRPARARRRDRRARRRARAAAPRWARAGAREGAARVRRPALHRRSRSRPTAGCSRAGRRRWRRERRDRRPIPAR